MDAVEPNMTGNHYCLGPWRERSSGIQERRRNLSILLIDAWPEILLQLADRRFRYFPLWPMMMAAYACRAILAEAVLKLVRHIAVVHNDHKIDAPASCNWKECSLEDLFLDRDVRHILLCWAT
jgi:hypothetical protein